VWNEQKYTKETQEYLRVLMVKFGLAIEDPTNEGDLIIPCLATRMLEIKNGEELKRWEYTMTSMTPPLGMSSTVIVASWTGLIRTHPVIECGGLCRDNTRGWRHNGESDGGSNVRSSINTKSTCEDSGSERISERAVFQVQQRDYRNRGPG